MKNFLMILIVCIIISLNCSLGADYENSWAYKNISRGINNNVVNGYEDGNFWPNKEIKRNEFIKLVVKCAEPQMLNGMDKWDEPYIEYALKNGYIIDGNIDFNISITRKEAFQIMYSYIAKYYKNGVTYKYNNKFYDYSGEDEKINYLLNNMLLIGFSDNTLRLNSNISRAEAISIIYRIEDYINKHIYDEIYNLNVFEDENISKYVNYIGNRLFLNSFQVENGTIVYQDKGRMDKYENMIIEDNLNDKALETVLKLIGVKNYVVNSYIRNIDAVNIVYGERDGFINSGSYMFEIYLFEKHKLLDNKFEYNVKVNIYKLWKELDEIKNNKLINELYIRKLENVLKLYTTEENVNVLIQGIKDGKEVNKSEIKLIKDKSKYYIYINS